MPRVFLPRGNITVTVLAARSTTNVTAAVAATAIAVTGNTMTSMTNAAWGTTIAVVAGSAIAWTTPDADGDSTDLADGDGGWDIGTIFAATDVHNSDYALWWHTDSTVIDISVNDGAQRAERDSSNVEVNAWIDISGAPTTISLLTADLQDYQLYGVEYYLFATTRESGTRKVGRCGPIRVFHYPTNNRDLTNPNNVNDMVDFTSNNTDYLDSGLLFALDNGAEDGTGVTSATWTLQTIDFDHNADVRLYYSTSALLTESDLVIAGADGSETITGLTGGTLLADTDTLLENDHPDYTWSIYTDDTDFVPAGTYYIYVASNDGYHQDLDIAHSQFAGQSYVVAHNPILILQDPWVDTVADPFTFPAGSQRYMNLNWGLTIAGDQDPDDSATIRFYLDDDTGNNDVADFNQTSIATLTATATATDDLVANGELIYETVINEDPDHQWDNHADIDMSLWSSRFPGCRGHGRRGRRPAHLRCDHQRYPEPYHHLRVRGRELRGHRGREHRQRQRGHQQRAGRLRELSPPTWVVRSPGARPIASPGTSPGTSGRPTRTCCCCSVTWTCVPRPPSTVPTARACWALPT
jgi:hypothetical protein